MIGRAIAEAGADFSVFHIGGSPFRNPSMGEIDGISFRYFPGKTNRPTNKLKRYLSRIRGAQLAIREIRTVRRERGNVAVYLHAPGIFAVALTLILRQYRIPVVLELSEWWPGRWTHFLRCMLIRISQGTIAISNPILTRLKPLCRDDHRLIRIPILVDCHEFAPQQSHDDRPESNVNPHILWCGNLAAAREDVSFMLQAAAEVYKRKRGFLIVLVGAVDDSTRAAISNEAQRLGLPRDIVQMTGYVSDTELRRLMGQATALFLPLWRSERSICRFPTKLGQYLASGTAVVTASIGDVGACLEHNSSSMLYSPGNVSEAADCIRILIEEPRVMRSIGRSGRDVALRNFDFRLYGQSLVEYFAHLTS